MITTFQEFQLREMYQEEIGSSFTHNGIHYNLNKLLALTDEAPIEFVPVADLSWVLQFDTPQEDRVLAADPTVPVLVSRTFEPTIVTMARSRITIAVPHSQEVVVDGLHRLAKAMRDGIVVLPARRVTQDMLNQCVLPLLPEQLTYEDYCAVVEGALNEGLRDKLSAVKRKAADIMGTELAEVRKTLAVIAEHLKVSKLHLLHMLKSRNVYDVLAAFGFSLVALGKCLHQVTQLVREGLFTIFKQLASSGVIKKLRSGLVKVDEVLDKYPLLRKVTGPVVAGLLFFMWTEMTFIGNADYDFDMRDIKQTLAGNYSLADLFASPEGLMFIGLFATGNLFTVSWLGHKAANIMVAVLYTACKDSGSAEVLTKLKSLLMHMG